MRGVNLIEHFIQDLQYAVRSVRKKPGFTLLAVLVMGWASARTRQCSA